ncbi:MAG TPA: hypothetical protein VFT43_08395, partial [Candidatus Polarisedimenticolia bacterium]|nr:hypothetical protein [Candidatus Polarisedimenticolia bacterium]
SGQQVMPLHLLRGLSERAADDHSLGWFRISGFTPDTGGRGRVGVVFRVTGDSIGVAAFDLNTNEAVPVDSAEPPAGH